METPRKNPFEELNDLLHRLPVGKGEEVALKLAVQVKQDYAPELEAEDSEVDGDERWEELLADPRSDILLDRLAEESKEERRNGTVKPLSVALKEYAYLLEDDNS